MSIVLGWIFFSVCVGVFAQQRRNRNGVGYFVLSLIISPLLAFALVAAMKEAAPCVIITGPKPDNGLVVAAALGVVAVAVLLVALLGLA